jgi:phosphomannomutase/phosphoglucomutase
MTFSEKPFPSHLFRAYDIRGAVSSFTPELVQAIAYGLCQQYMQAGQKKIVIGYDARLSSPGYAWLLQQIFEQHGFEVIPLGCCSSPLMYYSARNAAGNGIMVTASHNAVSDNGIKWIIQGEPPGPEMIQQVAVTAQMKFAAEPVPEIPLLQHALIVPYCLAYQHALLQDVKLERPFKVVLDGMNGSAGRCAALVLKKMGCELTAIRCEADGNFPDHAPDPSQEKHLVQIRDAVLKTGADIGIALDGDGDRLVVIDECGTVISADRMLSLFAEMCLKMHPGHQVVFDVKCSTMVKNTVSQLGGTPHMIRTGSTFLRKYLAQSGGKAVFGGEYAGHYVFNDGRGLGYDDGLYAALRILEYLSQSADLTLSQLFAAYPERCSTEDTYISTHSIEPRAVLSDVEIKSKRYGAQLSKIDGVRLDFEDGFGIIRASNTGEYFTIRFDADNPARLDDIRHTFVSMLSDRYPQIAQDILNAQ